MTSVINQDEATIAPAKNRILSLDVTRGYALFVVLLVNLFAVSAPIATTFFPGSVTPMPAEDLPAWLALMIGFEGVGRALFSMLFGAGMMLILQRLTAAHTPAKARNIYFRRLFLLALMGGINIYILMWWGDILLLYAVVGMVLYFYKRAKQKTLMIWLVIFALIPTFMTLLQAFGLDQIAPEFHAALALRESGQALSVEQQELLADLGFLLDPAVIEAEINTLRHGAPLQVWEHLSGQYISLNASSFLTSGLWDVLAAMLLGIYLYRSGFITGALSSRRYRVYLMMGLLVGVGLRAVGHTSHSLSGFDSNWPLFNAAFSQISRFALALAMIAGLNLMIKAKMAVGLQGYLSAVGRMALTNYLMQSVFYVFLFTSFGFGLYNQLSMMAMWGLAFGLFALQMLLSRLWLKNRRYGPMEYLWRKATYGRDF